MRVYTRCLEVNAEGKITYEFTGGLYYGITEQVQPCNYGGRTRLYGSTKTELVGLLNSLNLFTDNTIFFDEIV